MTTTATPSKAKKIIKKTLKGIFIFIGAFLLYVIIAIVHGTATDFQPEPLLPVAVEHSNQKQVVDKAELSFLNWNVGFGGQGKESTFFYDAGGFFTSKGKMVRAPRELVDKNNAGIFKLLKDNPVDFYLLQEVDTSSRRSHFLNQYQLLQQQLPQYTASFAINYNVTRVPLPILEPWNVLGKMRSGLATFAGYEATEVVRHQFPGKHGWPTRIFQLDRCMSVHRYKTSHPQGKELVVINNHNEAYDGGEIKAQELAYIKKFILEEYEQKGNYVVIGADWNQCPPGIAFDKNAKERGIATDSSYNSGNIAPDFLPEGWTWAYDPTVPTNRKLTDPYEDGKTFVTLIDYYLLSPNVELVEVKGIDHRFEYSDHQPVLLRVRLKEMGVDTVVTQ